MPGVLANDCFRRRSILNLTSANGRCRMHGGKSTGRPQMHGRYTKAAIAQRRRDRALIRALLALVRDCGD